MSTNRQTIELRFKTELQYRLHNVLVAEQFRFTVNPDLTVGPVYDHARKPVRIEILEGDSGEEIEIHSFNMLDPAKPKLNLFDEAYTAAEFKWMTDVPEGDDGQVEYLRRDLEILLRVRPRTMNAILQRS